MESIVLVVIVVALVLVLAVAGVILARRRQSQKLQQRFGPEYERTVDETGDRKAAEAELADRERRHSELDLRSLRPEERAGYQREWEAVQQGFVDNPGRALNRADTLVVEVMRTRGYPVDDFDRRADEISVAHPEIVHHYRAARDVHDATAAGPVDTEQQRHALTSYRSLVEALLGDEHGRDDRRREAQRNGRSEGYAEDGADTRRADVRRNEEQTR